LNVRGVQEIRTISHFRYASIRVLLGGEETPA